MTQDEVANIVAGLLPLLRQSASVSVALAPPTEGPWGRAIRYPIDGLGTLVGDGPAWGCMVLANAMDVDEAVSVALHELAHLAVWQSAPTAEQERVAALAPLWLAKQSYESLFLPSFAAAPPEKPDVSHNARWWRCIAHLIERAKGVGILAPWPAALRGLGVPWPGVTRLVRAFKSESATLNRTPITTVLAQPMPRRLGRLCDVLGIPD